MIEGYSKSVEMVEHAIGMYIDMQRVGFRPYYIDVHKHDRSLLSVISARNWAADSRAVDENRALPTHKDTQCFDRHVLQVREGRGRKIHLRLLAYEERLLMDLDG